MDEKIQIAAPDLIEDVVSRLGDRFGGAWIVSTDVGDFLHIGVPDDEPASRSVVLDAAGRYEITDRIVIDVVRYPIEQLESFYQQLGALIGAHTSEALIGYGVRSDLNSIELILSSEAPELVARAASVIPEDALVITTIPGGKVIAT